MIDKSELWQGVTNGTNSGLSLNPRAKLARLSSAEQVLEGVDALSVVLLRRLVLTRALAGRAGRALGRARASGLGGLRDLILPEAVVVSDAE